MPARESTLPPLLPRPQRALRRPGHFALVPDRPIVLAPDSDANDFASAGTLRDAIRARCGISPPIETHTRSGDLGPRIELRRRQGSAAGTDAYTLRVTPGLVTAEASGASGLRYAAETLSQLVDERGRVPACRIDDAPDFAVRGFLLDVSRGKVPTLASLKHLVDRLAACKMNALMLYVEHVFRFRRHPEIGADASALDAETIRELDRYAAERHVELIPNLQSLGHMQHVLGLPRYEPLAESGARWTLACARPATYRLLRDLYDEYLPNFSSGYFHANCAEPWDLGRGRSRALSERLGSGGLFLHHATRIAALARERGRRPMLWADFVHRHPQRIGELERDWVLCDWGYEADDDYDRVARLTRRGFECWVCPGTSSWNALFPRLDNAITNITGWADAGRRHGARGLLLTDWGDFGHYNLQGNSWLALAWAAQQSWSGSEPTQRFDRAFTRVFFGDRHGTAAKLYRELGSIHDAGFRVTNSSPLQFLYFDPLDPGDFVRAAAPARLRRTRRRLARVRDRLAGAAGAFGPDAVTHAELVLAADASLHAVDKAMAGRRFAAWRDDPATLDARGRRTLARSLTQLADAQVALRQRLRKLWRARCHPSNFAIVGRRLDRAVASLRRAARALARNRTPTAVAPTAVTPELTATTLRASLNAAGGAARRPRSG